MSAPDLQTLQAMRQTGLEQARALLEQQRDGLKAARTLSAAQDEIITSAFSALLENAASTDASLGEMAYCLCATGGYGRGELAPGSDIDLLLLHGENPPLALQSTYSDLLYLLWDMGLKVGHALRQPEECAAMAAQDPVSAAAIMDVRVLCGDAKLAERLHLALRAKSSARADREFVSAKLSERDQRHVRQGSTRYMVEPNIKEGKGGLRDLQTLGWLAMRLEPDCNNAREALAHFLDAQSLRQYDQALRFMWTVRFWLHLCTGRAEDRLGFDLQPELARLMRYRDTPAAERLMKAYFLKVRDVGMMTRVFCAKLEMIAAKRAPTGLSRFLPRRRKALKDKAFVTEAGRLDFFNASQLSQAPLALLRLFETADAIGRDIHPDALRAVDSHLSSIDAAFRENPDAAQIFLNCLTRSRDPETLLRIMSESGVLGRYIPEYGHIVGRTQFNMYHRYTVDEHTLRAIGILHDLLQKKPKNAPDWVPQIARSIEHRSALYLAMLLHDTGKGKGDQQIAGAVAATQACKRLRLDDEQTRLVSWLVGHHLLMSDTAQQRDLGDPRTILDFAKIVQTPARLRLLLLLTIADISAVGPEVWNGWKERLLRELFEATESLFRGKAARNLETLQQHAQSRAALARQHFLDVCKDKNFAKKWTSLLGASYWTAFENDTLTQQGLWAAQVDTDDPASGIFLEALPSNASTVMRVLAKDAPGLFAKLCGAVCVAGGNIAGARIFTTLDGRAFDVFYIQDRDGQPFGQNNPRALERLNQLAAQVLAGNPLPKAAQQPVSRRGAAFSVIPSVVFDQEASALQTVIETSGRDRQGLLFDLTNALWHSRLHIHSAHIATYGARAVDVFYVGEHDGQKMTHTRRINALGAKLKDVLQAGQQGTTPAKIEQAVMSKRR
jgi:[protein-PII] uridylyltransferase